MTMKPHQRPLSPHLQIYRMQSNMIFSIAHRFTGFANALGIVVLSLWFVSIALGGASFALMQCFLSSWIGFLFLLGWSWSVAYHFCNGIRHLIWDTVRGLEVAQILRSGWVVLGCSVLLMAGFWVSIFWF